MRSQLLQQVQDSAALQQSFFEAELDHIQAQADDMAERLRRGCKILICGNGGSAATAQHFVAALSGGQAKGRKALAGIALTADSTMLTAIGNDYGFACIFSRQVEALARPGDLLIGISRSGDSDNIIQAVESAEPMGVHTLGLLGGDGGKLKGMVDDALVVPSTPIARVQEIHMMVCHFWCEILDERLK